jgi:hypothetical protein
MPPGALLAAALRRDPAEWPADAGVAFETALLATAREHGVAALLASTPAVLCWPHTVQRALRDVRRGEAVMESLRREHLRRLLATLREAEIRCLLIKGAQLAYTHYTQPWLRPRFDTDLLVPVADRERADAALRGLGYEAASQVGGGLVSHQRQYERWDRHLGTDVIDLHWKITNPHLFAEALTFDELAAAARAIPELGEHAYGLSNVHALILACVHRVAHHCNSDLLIWLYDIHALASAMTADERAALLELARVKRLRSICASGLDIARHQYGTPHPAGWLDRLRPGSDEETEPTAVFLRPDRRRIDILWSDLRAVGGWTQKMQLLREHLFPPTAYMRARYGHDTPLLLAYADRVVTGVGRWFRAPS